MTKRIVVLVISVVLLLVGASVAVAGGALMAVFGSDNTLAAGPERVSTDTSALVVVMDDIHGSNGFATTVDDPTLKITDTSPGRDAFIGIAPKSDVDRYLANVAVDKATDFDVDHFRFKTDRQEGSTRPSSPAAQLLWTARGSGRQATLDWKITDGSYRMVLIYADASPGVAVNGRFALTMPHLFGIGLAILIGGIIAAVIGVVLLIVGIRMRPRTAVPPAAPYRP
jgi:hypothetical protein